jgi:hypothetical protein
MPSTNQIVVALNDPIAPAPSTSGPKVGQAQVDPSAVEVEILQPVDVDVDPSASAINLNFAKFAVVKVNQNKIHQIRVRSYIKKLSTLIKNYSGKLQMTGF